MKQLKIAKIIDQWGWAYDYTSREMQKYTKHNIHIQKYDNICVDGFDIIYFPSPNICKTLNYTDICKEARKKNIKIIGAYSGENIQELYPDYDLIVGISPTIKNNQIKKYNKNKVCFMPESIDTDFFNFENRTYENFQVGYIGSRLPVKRTWILQALGHYIKYQTNHGKQFFNQPKITYENDNQIIDNSNMLQDSKNFYKSIDCLVLSSKTEAMPRSVMESCSMGLPVISTNCGSVPLLLGDSCICKNTIESEIITEMKLKLDKLKENSEHRKEISIRNRKHIEKYFSWKNNIELWDNMFESIMDKNYDTIHNIENKWITDVKGL